MELVITQNFLNGCAGCKDSTLQKLESFLFIKLSNVTLITEFSDEDEWEMAATENPLWRSLLDIPASQKKCIPQIKKLYKQHEYYGNTSYPFKLFLTDEDNKTCEELGQKFGYAFLSLDNIEEKKEPYLKPWKNKHLPIDTFSNPRLTSWNDLKTYRHPANAMIILDMYLFKEVEEKKGKRSAPFSSIENNILELFRSLIPNSENTIDFQLLIITMKGFISLSDPEQPKSHNDRLKFIKDKLQKFFAEQIPNLKISITVVDYNLGSSLNQNQQLYDFNNKEHDRCVCTNYLFFDIGAGINIFNPDQQPMKRTKINFHIPTLYQDDRNVTNSFLHNVKAYMNLLYNHFKDKPEERNLYIMGEGKNRLLDSIA
jgi:hypothetical protein